MNKSTKRANTLLEYMGFKDPDINSTSHDEWCLKLLNENLVKKIITQILSLETPQRPRIMTKIKCGSCGRIFHDLNLKRKDFGCDCFPSNGYSRTHIGVMIQGNYIIKIRRKQIEEVLTKHGNNGYSQRLGFLDVYYDIDVIMFSTFTNGERVEMYETHPCVTPYSLFFEVKTSHQTIGAITREIEYYKDVVGELYGRKVIPILIAKDKIPLDQFTSITFDEITKMEKGLNDK